MKTVYTCIDSLGSVIFSSDPLFNPDSTLGIRAAFMPNKLENKLKSDPMSYDSTELTDMVEVMNWMVK
jgi:hypothetical protein